MKLRKTGLGPSQIIIRRR